MKDRTWTIGSLPDCDICIDIPTVSGRHCRLTQRGQTFILEDLGSTNGTFLAGEPINGPRDVCRGDEISLGRSTLLPWPDLSSITVGRLADNDVVIPLDTVSGHHARLERQGNRVFLVDLDSTNGTALNDPFNKISRAAVQPSDVVFFGTHQVAAAELLAELPKELTLLEHRCLTTRLEASTPADLGMAFSPLVSKGATAQLRPSRLGASPPSYSWALGAALGVAGVLAVVVVSWAIRAGPKDKDTDAGAGQTKPQNTKPQPPSQIPPPPIPPPEFDEQLVRKAERGVYMLCIRTGPGVFFIRSTAWAILPRALVCPTDVLKHWEGVLKKGDKLDDCIVVCNSSKTLRILKHSPAGGEGVFLSLALPEAVAEAVPFEPQAVSAFVPEPGLKLAVLVAAGPDSAPGQPNDDPATISRRLVYLKIDRIQRDAQQAPLALYCTAAEDPGPATAAPVFDGAGHVVGCIESATKTEARVVPLGRLPALWQDRP